MCGTLVRISRARYCLNCPKTSLSSRRGAIIFQRLIFQYGEIVTMSTPKKVFGNIFGRGPWKRNVFDVSTFIAVEKRSAENRLYPCANSTPCKAEIDTLFGCLQGIVCALTDDRDTHKLRDHDPVIASVASAMAFTVNESFIGRLFCLIFISSCVVNRFPPIKCFAYSLLHRSY